MKLKTIYRCENCGYSSPKWLGQCPDCEAWNSMSEEVVETASKKQQPKSLTDFSSEVVRLSEASSAEMCRRKTEINELDRLFGGGLVKGQIVLLAGSPGIGKSTLMLQIAQNLAAQGKVLYVSGEESIEQISARAKRLGITQKEIYLLAETNLQKIIETFRDLKPDTLIIDSIQTVFHPEFTSSPGTVGQIRESAAELLRLCKPAGTALFLLGHVTKEGALAGPKILEHIVDTVLYFDTEQETMLRFLRVYKNRFGPTLELGIFQMEEKGLMPVDDASFYFSAGTKSKPTKGRAFSIAIEGSRPIVTEIQALVAPTRYPFPRRMVTGMDLNRCQILFAAIEKHLGLNLENKDIFVSLAGGIKLRDPALDLAVCAAVISSIQDIEISHTAVFIGETGILGQLARVSMVKRRLEEARRLGFKEAFIPPLPEREKIKPENLQIHQIEEVGNLVNYLKPLHK